MSTGDDARRYLRAHALGVLSTHSKTAPGYPFGSVVPFVCDHAGHPCILISALAEHTRSIEVDARASLIVHDFSIANQAGPRLTLLADAAPCEDEAMQARYLRFLPEAERFASFGDFRFWRLAPRQCLFVRGFGRIEWIGAADYAPPPNDIAAIEASVLEHMNADHADALAACCRHFHGVEASDAVMVGIDVDGFDVRTGARLLRLEFDGPVTDAAATRSALAALAARARGA